MTLPTAPAGDPRLKAAARGETDAVRALYDQFSARVYSIARRVVGNDALAEDVAQDTWIRILRGLQDFRGESQLSSWIHRIAVNTALASQQKDDRQGLRAQDFESSPELPSKGGSHEDRILTRMQLEGALDQIPPGMRRVLVLHDVEGYTHEEIAVAVGTTASTSRSQLGRARAKLRAVLERDDRAIPFPGSRQ